MTLLSLNRCVLSMYGCSHKTDNFERPKLNEMTHLKKKKTQLVYLSDLICILSIRLGFDKIMIARRGSVKLTA